MNYEEKFALLFGIMAGDGCLSRFVSKRGSRSYIISISGHYYDDRAFFESIVCPLVDLLRRENKKTPIKNRLTQGKIELNFCDKKLFFELNKLGFPIGKKGPNLEIPKHFYGSNLMKYIIQGFLATDGSLVLTKNPNKFYPRIEGTSISEKLINQIVDYLNKIGMKGSSYKAKRNINNSWEKRYQLFRFQFNGKKNLLLFKELIGFINPKHNKKFLNFIKYDKRYDVLMKGVPTQKQRFIRNKVSLDYDDCTES